MWQLIKSVTKKEWWLVGWLSLLMVVITAVPYLYGYMTTPPDMVYTGVHYLTPGDTNVFLSMIESTKQGDNVFLNLYTGEFQHRLFINPLWLSVGWLAKIFHLPSLLALHVARSIWIAIFIFILYLLLAYLFQNVSKRKIILLIVLFASGLGVFLNPFLFNVNNLYEHPTDMWVAESVTFLTLYHSPHLIASLTLVVLIFLLMLLAFEKDNWRYSLGAGVAGLFLIWFHPFNGPTIYVALGLHMLLLSWWQRKFVWSYVKHFIILACLPMPAVIYLYLISQADWVIRNWSAQNILPSPSVWMYIIGYGLILILALRGLWISLKKPYDKRFFIIAWLFSSSMLIYIPLSFQRRMSEGLHIPLAILAGMAIYYLIERWRSKDGSIGLKGYALIMFLVIFLPLSNIQILGQDIYMYQTKKDLPYYLYTEEVQAMHWLRDNSGKEEVTFSSAYMGNFIPAYSGRVVWIGHGPQTINLPDKILINDWFWEDDSESEQKHEFLNQDGIDYVWFGRKEKEMGSFNPSTKKYLKLVFGNARVAIYKVL